MPSHSILPDARRAAIEAAFDEALAEVRAAGDVALLQECRAIFRKRVPLHLRAYVAAALALKSAGRQPDHRRQAPEASRDKRKDGRQGKPAPAQVADAARKPEKNRPSSAGRGPTPGLDATVGRDATVRHDVSIRHEEPRENRYRGEGVTLFVSAGRRQRFYARVAVKVLLEVPGVSGETIGDIRTMDNYSFIVIDPVMEETVIEALHGYDFKGRILAVNRARKKGESAPVEEEQAQPARDDYGLPAAENRVASSGADEYVDDTRLVEDGPDDAADDGLSDDFVRPAGLGHYADDIVDNDDDDDSDDDDGDDDDDSDDDDDDSDGDEPKGNV